MNDQCFFTHILAHELTHGIGPHEIVLDGRKTTPRHELKELYSTIEEAKADATGLFMLQYMRDRKLLPGGGPDARGMALQFNYLMDKGAFVPNPDGTFSVEWTEIKPAVRELTRDLLLLEATGDYAGAKNMLERLAVMRPILGSALERLKEIPVDIIPTPVTANGLAGSNHPARTVQER